MDNTDTDSDLMQIEWYHPTITRHVAESLLLQNGFDGMYLLRPSKKSRDLSLSIRCKDAVKHFNITWTGTTYKFGMAEFESLQSIISHFENHPLIGGESGILTVCKQGYPRQIEEPDIYDKVRIHAELGRNASVVCRRDAAKTDLSIGSKEGFLTKQGGNVKNWKNRWFVLHKNTLKYFKDRGDEKPVRVLDLAECSQCAREYDIGKENCFRICFPWRTFYMYAGTEEESQSWVDTINWKLKNLAKMQ